MLELEKVKAGSEIEYIGDSFAYSGKYTVIKAESTYENPNDCPVEKKGELMIVEFMNNDTPMFISIKDLKQNEWRIVT